MSPKRVRWPACVFLLPMTVIAGASPELPADPAPRASDGSVAATAKGKPERTELPYQLWPGEVVSAQGMVV